MTRTSPALRTGRGFIAGDPLRAIACFGVFVFHAGYFAILGSGYARLLSPDPTSRTMYGPLFGVLLASIGTVVPIFFTLSGYLIARPFFRAFIDGTRPPSIVNYVRRRAFRIVPVFWAVLTVTLLIWGLHGASTRQVVDLYGFSANWKSTPFATIFGQAWTLDVEVRFYLSLAVGALVLMVLRRPLRQHRWLRATLLILAAMGASVGSLVAFRNTAATSTLGLSSMLWTIAPGLLLAALEPILATRVPGGRSIRWATTAALAAGMAAIFAYRLLLPRFHALTGLSPVLVGRVYGTIFVLAVVGGALLRQWSGEGCWRILDNRPLQWFGSRSYSFYLIHFAMLRFLAFRLRGIGGYKVELAILLPLALAVTGLLAEIAFRLVEYPTMRLGQSQRAGLLRPRKPKAVKAPSAPGSITPAEVPRAADVA